jgi:hypothetical protein
LSRRKPATGILKDRGSRTDARDAKAQRGKGKFVIALMRVALAKSNPGLKPDAFCAEVVMMGKVRGGTRQNR